MADKGLKIEIVTAKFNAMLRELAQIDPSVEFSQVVRSEAAAVAAGAMSRTKAASVANINKRADARKFVTFNGKTYYLGNHYPDAIWDQADRINKDSRATKLGARGISKQSWAHVAKSFGSPVKAPAYVMAANYKGKQWTTDGTSLESRGPTGYSLTIENSSPVVQKAGGQFALAVSMNARTRYFERNMAHAFYDTLAHRAKKYPGIFASQVPAPLSLPTEVPAGN